MSRQLNDKGGHYEIQDDVSTRQRSPRRNNHRHCPDVGHRAGLWKPGHAANGLPDFTIVFPAGFACSFELKIEGWDGKQHTKTLTDKNGIVRTITAGTGSALRYTNDATGATFSTKSNGSATHTTYNLDGTQTWSMSGHFVILLFSTDFPPGPSTTLYNGGHAVFIVDQNGNYHMEEESGNIVDICAVLNP